MTNILDEARKYNRIALANTPSIVAVLQALQETGVITYDPATRTFKGARTITEESLMHVLLPLANR